MAHGTRRKAQGAWHRAHGTRRKAQGARRKVQGARKRSLFKIKQYKEKTMRLSEKKVLVIGGSSGMGLAIAAVAFREGVTALISSRSESRLKEAAEKIGAGVNWHAVDFTDATSVKSLFAAVGPVDHLVIPGSQVRTGPIKELAIADAKSSMASKFFGPYSAVKESQVNPQGSIILFSGILSRRPDKGSPILAAINAAVETLGKALAVELAPIRVNVISPGMTRDTEAYLGMSEQAREEMFFPLRHCSNTPVFLMFNSKIPFGDNSKPGPLDPNSFLYGRPGSAIFRPLPP
ncbi:MAG: SDR family NAD(P)-dependent oxidoreductase [Deltaproteobacteria bacterium]|nr:SDR family NAD(P)-dependent oxidoreductase [Deltaproteobacteria bacterium]